MKPLIKLLAAGALTLFAHSALAIIVDYDLGVVPGTEVPNDGSISLSNPNANLDATTMSWIAPSAPADSSLVFGDFGPIDVPTDGTPTQVGSFTHNNVIIESAFSWIADLRSTLFITGGGVVNDATTTITLTETLNSAPCVSPNPNGTVCDDFFTNIGNDQVTVASGQFSNMGMVFNWDLDVGDLDGFVILGDEFYTAEADSNTGEVVLTITKASVTEPTTALLLALGLGLVGLVGGRKDPAEGRA